MPVRFARVAVTLLSLFCIYLPSVQPIVLFIQSQVFVAFVYIWNKIKKEWVIFDQCIPATVHFICLTIPNRQEIIAAISGCTKTIGIANIINIIIIIIAVIYFFVL